MNTFLYSNNKSFKIGVGRIIRMKRKEKRSIFEFMQVTRKECTGLFLLQTSSQKSKTTSSNCVEINMTESVISLSVNDWQRKKESKLKSRKKSVLPNTHRTESDRTKLQNRRSVSLKGTNQSRPWMQLQTVIFMSDYEATHTCGYIDKSSQEFGEIQ